MSGSSTPNTTPNSKSGQSMSRFLSRISRTPSSTSIASQESTASTLPPKTSKPLTYPAKPFTQPSKPPLDAETESKIAALRTYLKEYVDRKPPQDEYKPWEQKWMQEQTLYHRYLRAAKGDLENAKKRIQGTLEWRREYQPELIPPSEVSPEAETGKHIISGFDNDGRPILYLRPGRENTTPSPRQIRYLVWSLERAIDMMPPGQETMAIVVDYASATSASNPSLSTARLAANILQNHYVERLGRAFVCNVPWFINAFFTALGPFLDPLTKEKIRFNASLKDFIPVEQLDAEWPGGKYNYEFDFKVYWDTIVDFCGIAQDGTRDHESYAKSKPKQAGESQPAKLEGSSAVEKEAEVVGAAEPTSNGVLRSDPTSAAGSSSSSSNSAGSSPSSSSPASTSIMAETSSPQGSDQLVAKGPYKALTTAEEYEKLVEEHDTFLFDCDGVLWSGNDLLPGVVSVLEKLRKRGKTIIFVTNNASKSRAAYLKKFQAMGIKADIDEIFSSAYASAVYLSKVLQFPKDRKVYVVGMEGIEEELDAEGILHCGGTSEEDKVLLPTLDFSSLQSEEAIDSKVGAVLCGFDMHLTYVKLAKAFKHLTREGCEGEVVEGGSGGGCHFILTNDDSTFPAKGGPWPGSGSLSAPLVFSTKRKPTIVGKPHKHMMDCIVAKKQFERSRAIMVGDRLDTDIDFARKGGVKSLMVLTGISKKEEIDREGASIVPDFLIQKLGDLDVLA